MFSAEDSLTTWRVRHERMPQGSLWPQMPEDTSIPTTDAADERASAAVRVLCVRAMELAVSAPTALRHFVRYEGLLLGTTSFHSRTGVEADPVTMSVERLWTAWERKSADAADELDGHPALAEVAAGFRAFLGRVKEAQAVLAGATISAVDEVAVPEVTATSGGPFVDGVYDSWVDAQALRARALAERKAVGERRLTEAYSEWWPAIEEAKDAFIDVACAVRAGLCDDVAVL